MFGSVKIARHRLDGMVYAIKVTRSEVVGNTLERSVMNEVFAHAALMKHKHVVRYVEKRMSVLVRTSCNIYSTLTGTTTVGWKRDTSISRTSTAKEAPWPIRSKFDEKKENLFQNLS